MSLNSGELSLKRTRWLLCEEQNADGKNGGREASREAATVTQTRRDSGSKRGLSVEMVGSGHILDVFPGYGQSIS